MITLEEVKKIKDLLQLYPEFNDDLDETACPTGSVTCPICDGGGDYDKRRRCPIQHRPNCLRVEVNEILKRI